MTRRPSIEQRGWLNLGVVIAATIAIAVLINVLVAGLRWRADLTEHGVNTLSEVSRDAAAALDGLEIHLYISPDLPPRLPLGDGTELNLQGLPQALTDRLAEYVAHGDDARIVRVEDDLIAEAERNHLRTFSGKGGALSDAGRFEFQRYALGATFHYQDQVEVLELAIQPDFLEFEITRRLLRLKEKADFAGALKDMLDATDTVARAVRACTEAFRPEDTARPAAAFSATGDTETLAALRTMVPEVTRACTTLGDAVKAGAAVASDIDAYHRLIRAADAMAKEAGAWVAAVTAPKPPETTSLAAAKAQIIAYGDGLARDVRAVEEAPGQRRIGFVCRVGSFCPFAEPTPLIPAELKPADPSQAAQHARIIAFLTQLDQQIGTTLRQIERSLFQGRGYAVTPVDLDRPLPDDLDALVLIGPSRDLSDWQLYQLDQFVLSGGSVVIFVNPAEVALQPVGANGRIAPAEMHRRATNVDAFLAHLGLAPTGELVAEPRLHGDVTLTRYVPSGAELVAAEAIATPYPLLPTFTDMATDDPLVRATPTLTLPYTTWFELKPGDGRQLTPLAWSSARAASIAGVDLPLDPQQQREAVLGMAAGKAMPVVATATGTFSSYFHRAPQPAAPRLEDETGPAEREHRASGRGRVLVVGSSLGLGSLDRDVIFDGFNPTRLSVVDGALVTEVERYRARFETWSRRLDEIRSTIPQNMQFLQGVLDWSVQREAVAELSSKQMSERPLRSTDASERTRIRLFGLLLAPTLLLMLGGALMLRRRARQRSLRA